MGKVKEMAIRYYNCSHTNTEYIPQELDTNIVEGITCLDCGLDLPLPQEDDNF
tara:strand:- start:2805 stop:2963 length:159 start_codon:yes stop_codon:yes gene_type:complete